MNARLKLVACAAGQGVFLLASCFASLRLQASKDHTHSILFPLVWPLSWSSMLLFLLQFLCSLACSDLRAVICLQLDQFDGARVLTMMPPAFDRSLVFPSNLIPLPISPSLT